jgi:hypothetical protein
MALASVVSTGLPLTSTVGLLIIQGPAIIGRQGIGVSTPSAAAVALATVGFAILWHMPNVAILAGLISSMVPAGIPLRTVAFAIA